jgi:hypothetical protein
VKTFVVKANRPVLALGRKSPGETANPQGTVRRSSDPSYRGEGLKLERSPRDEGPRDEGEGESLRITRLGRGPHLLLSTSLPISSAFTVPISVTFKVFWVVQCPQRQYRSILPFSLSTMEPDVRGLRAVALIGGVVNNKETGTISA